MRVIDLYTELLNAAPFEGYSFFENKPELRTVLPILRSWEIDGASVRDWLSSKPARAKRPITLDFLSQAHAVVELVESVFETELGGTIVFMPSFGDFDGFARYELGEHCVLIGVDYPDEHVDVNYLKSITSHELSHVMRDTSPHVWGHLGKPLREVTRQEYLNAGTAQEHLASEGLATLFAQTLFPDIEAATHHYYQKEQYDWCMTNADKIDQSLKECLRSNEDVWSFYGQSRVSQGSPAYVQYFWAAKQIALRLQHAPDPLKALVELHREPTSTFKEFFLKGNSA